MKTSNVSTTTISGTTRELEKVFGLDYVTVTGFLKALEKAGLAVKSSKQNNNKKGRSSTVWTINSSFTLEL